MRSSSSSEARPGTSPVRGRPRDASRDAAIEQATRELLHAVGYDAMSVGAIAQRAGVSKATIYRRWDNKAAIVASAIEHLASATPPAPRADTLRDGLLQTVGWLAEQIADQDMAMLAAVLAGMRSDPDLAAAMRDRLRRDEAAMIAGTLHHAAEHGERLHPNADVLFAEIAPAVIMHRLLVAGEPCDRAFVRHIVDDVLMPLLTVR